MTMTNPVGRPTKYTPELVRAAREYLINYEKHDQVIPSIAGLSGFLKVNRDTLYDWAKQEDKTEFSDIMREIVTKQEAVLLNSGLKGDFNSAITKLVLGKHGYHEKRDTEHSGPDGGAIVVQSPADRLKEQMGVVSQRIREDG